MIGGDWEAETQGVQAIKSTKAICRVTGLYKNEAPAEWPRKDKRHKKESQEILKKEASETTSAHALTRLQ